MMLGLPADTWLCLVNWMAIGTVIHFSYGIRHSTIRARIDPAVTAAAPHMSADISALWRTGVNRRRYGPAVNRLRRIGPCP
ncbi:MULTISPECIES: amino acid permease C-terminal domain-containing protein [Paraburkholderia]|uniref:Cationic amino acid transporter C-terminal domain-containing protein n=1 Tax=Paraburkholderia podalyriae TaxID=1938811 RepID=A0ABR7Q233_9BURK|nr:hypothetical protein [Paraburkholderia podalyriae]